MSIHERFSIERDSLSRFRLAMRQSHFQCFFLARIFIISGNLGGLFLCTYQKITKLAIKFESLVDWIVELMMILMNFTITTHQSQLRGKAREEIKMSLKIFQGEITRTVFNFANFRNFSYYHFNVITEAWY
jgi:hypothetical protein